MADRVVSYDFRGKFTNLQAGLATAGKSVQDLGTKLTALDKNGAQMRAGLDTLGGAAGKFGLVAAAGLGAAVLASANFDQAMSNVQAATHETADNMDLLREAALKAGADTAFSATEAAAGVEELAKAGVSTADILGGGLAGALDLAAAGGLDVARAAEISATALTQFKLAGEDVGHVADLLAAGAGKAQGSVDDMGMALKQSGLVAAQTGLSIEETTGTLAAFASAGLIGSDAGTSFKTMLQSLTPTGAKARDLMDELGISAYDAQGNFVGMTEFAASLEAGLADLSVEQQNAAMKTIFGSDAVRAASVVFEQGAEGIGEWIGKVDDAGYAAETAASRMDNLKGDWEEFTGSLETALIGTGDGAQGPLRSLIQNATAALNVFNKLPPAAKDVTAGLLGITAVLGGGLWFTSKVVNGIASTKEALGQLGLSSDKASKAMKGVAVAGAGLAALTVAAAGIRAIQRATDESLPGLEQLTTGLLDLRDGEIDNLGGEFDSLGDSIARVADKSNAESLTDALQTPFVGLFGEAGSLRVARAEIDALDAALAGLASSAGPEAAAQAFMALQTSGQLTATQLRDLGGLLPQYQDALAGAANSTRIGAEATEGAAGAQEGFAGATDGAAGAVREETASLEANIKAMQDKRDAALAAFDAETGWRQALKDATAQAKNNSAGIRGNTAAALENRGALSNLAGAWNGLSNQAQNMPGRFASARKSFIDTAVAMGVPRKEAIALARELLEIPTKVVTTTSVNTGNSHSQIQGVFDHLTRLNGKTATTYIHTVRTGGDGVDFVSGGRGRATGGYISGPGTGTSDSIPARLSNGEYVIKASAVAQYGVGFMDAINAQRFASGGYVGAKMTDIRGDHGLHALSRAVGEATNAAGKVEYGFEKVSGSAFNLADASMKELKRRERMLEKELAHAEKRMQAELANLKELKDAWRGLRDSVSSNFMSSLFGDVDLVAALRSGMVDADGLNAWMGANSIGGGATEENIAAYLATLSAAQVAELQGQANVGVLEQDTQSAEAFQAALEDLVALGFDGGAFAELAASGNLEQAQWLAMQGAGYIDDLEQKYDLRNSSAIQAGVYAANAELRDEIKAQTRVFEKAKGHLERIEAAERRVEKRIEHLERLAERNPRETGRAVGEAVNGAAANGNRKAS